MTVLLLFTCCQGHRTHLHKCFHCSAAVQTGETSHSGMLLNSCKRVWGFLPNCIYGGFVPTWLLHWKNKTQSPLGSRLLRASCSTSKTLRNHVSVLHSHLYNSLWASACKSFIFHSDKCKGNHENIDKRAMNCFKLIDRFHFHIFPGISQDIKENPDY